MTRKIKPVVSPHLYTNSLRLLLTTCIKYFFISLLVTSLLTQAYVVWQVGTRPCIVIHTSFYIIFSTTPQDQPDLCYIIPWGEKNYLLMKTCQQIKIVFFRCRENRWMHGAKIERHRGSGIYVQSWIIMQTINFKNPYVQNEECAKTTFPHESL